MSSRELKRLFQVFPGSQELWKLQSHHRHCRSGPDGAKENEQWGSPLGFALTKIGLSHLALSLQKFMFLAGSCHKGRESSRNGKALGECLVPSEADGTEPRACMQIFPKIVFLYCCLAPSSLVLLPGLCSVTAAGWQTPAFTFSRHFFREVNESSFLTL